jgi:hypothetical protein
MKIPLPTKDSVFIEIVKSIRLIKQFQIDIKILSEKIKTLPKSFQISLPGIKD